MNFKLAVNRVFKQDVKISAHNLLDSNIQPMESESNEAPTHHLLAESPWSLFPLPVDRRNSERRTSRRMFPASFNQQQFRYRSTQQVHPIETASPIDKPKIIAMSKLQLLPNGYSQITIRRTVPT